MLPGLVLVLAALAGAPGADPQTPDGAWTFQRCYACHSLDPNERDLTGPNLRGLFGRRAGALDEFDYSPAMRAAGWRGLVWSDDTLDRFLEDPEEFVPGTRMAGVRLQDPGERRALVQWLKREAQ